MGLYQHTTLWLISLSILITCLPHNVAMLSKRSYTLNHFLKLEALLILQQGTLEKQVFKPPALLVSKS